MTRLVILNDAPRWHDNPLLQLTEPALYLVLLPKNTRQCDRLDRQIWQAFAQSAEQQGLELWGLEVNETFDWAGFCKAMKLEHIHLAEPTAIQEQELVQTLQQQAQVHCHDVNSLLLAELRPTSAMLGRSYSQFRRHYEPQLAVSPPQVSGHSPVSLKSSDILKHWGGFLLKDLKPEPITTLSLAPFGPELQQDIKRTPSEHAWQDYVKHYLTHHVQHYKQTRNQLFGPSFASFLAIPLARGILSVRWVYQQLQQHEQQQGPCAGSEWLRFELWWREYFRWLSRELGVKLFRRAGLGIHAPLPLVAPAEQQRRLLAWQQGKTGMPMVDANMRLLRQQGVMSNRGRQLVASYLVFDLGVDWRYGARWFEQQLLDYDVASNYGNWAYIAGALFSPARWFNQAKQAIEYDPSAEFVRWLLPERASHSSPAWTAHLPYLSALEVPFDVRWQPHWPTS